MITLEMIDHVMDVTGEDYATVRKALLAADGDMEQAIRNLEGEQDEDVDRFTLVERLQEELGITWTEAKARLEKADWNYKVAAGSETADEDSSDSNKEDPWRAKRENLEVHWEQLWETIQDFAKRGLATKLIIRKEGKDAININLGIGVLGIVAAPFATIAGLGAALFTDYEVLIELHDGRVINLIQLITDRERGEEDKSWDKYREPSAEENVDSHEPHDSGEEHEVHEPEVKHDPRDPHTHDPVEDLSDNLHRDPRDPHA